MQTSEQPAGTFADNCGQSRCNWCGQLVNDPVREAATALLDVCREFVRVMEDPRTTAAMPATVKKAKAAIAEAEKVKVS